MSQDGQLKHEAVMIDEEGKGNTTEGATSSQSTQLGSENEKQSQDKQETVKSARRSLNPLRLQKAPPIPEEREVCREYRASIVSCITFQWIAPLIKTGYLRQLETQDVWSVNPDRKVDLLTARFDIALKRRTEKGSKKALIWALFDTFRTEFIIGGICQVVSMILSVVTPYLVRNLTSYAMDAYAAHHGNHPSPNLGRGLGFAFGIPVMQAVQTLCLSQAFYRGMICGGQIRAVLVSTIYTKAMKLSGRAKAGSELPHAADKQGTKRPQRQQPRKDISTIEGSGWGNGRIITLMGVDVDRIDRACGLIHMLWTTPVVLGVALIFMVINIGYSALPGYGLAVFGAMILAYFVKSLISLRRAVNKITDQRVSLTQEILSSVKFVKFFGWESSFLQRLENTRKREISSLRRLLVIRHAITVGMLSLPALSSMLSFITYALTNHSLSPDRIFSSLALFNALRMPLAILNLAMTQATDAWTALCRIQEFLLAEEREESIVWESTMANAIEVEHASFTWERVRNSDGPTESRPSQAAIASAKVEPASTDALAEQEAHSKLPFQLVDMDFEVGRGELIAIIGPVGSGKTSLLAALAGDMRQTTGNVRMGVTRGYCPQYAWVQNTTVRNNILFGREYDEARYNEVIDACALRSDLAMFPAGDQTEIGERGITISGGQKQRLNIARAIYSDSELVLMDDPLSAVDAHVGRHIMDKAICGLLKHRCRVLATHQLHVLGRCDRIIVMEHGKIHAIGTFDILMRTSDVFQRLMSITSQQDALDQEPSNTGATTDEKPETARRVPGGALMQKEDMATGSVGWDVLRTYIKASGSYLNVLVSLCLTLTVNGALVMSGLWLSFWTSNKYPGLTTGQYVGIYIAVCCSQFIAMYGFAAHVTIVGANASKEMLHRAMYRILRAPMSFFDTTPMGRITNRFSKDVQVMDSDLPDSIRLFVLTLSQITATVGMVIAFYYYFAIALGPLVLMFVFAASYYRASARNLKRHEAVLRSGVFARFGEAIAGSATIQAYQAEEHFKISIHKAIDEMNGAYFLTFANQRWLGVRLDMIGTLLTLVTSLLVVTSRLDVSPSIAGLVLSYVVSITQSLGFTVRQFADVDNNMNAAERVNHYGTQLEEEAPLHLTDVGSEWPSTGRITFSDVQMRYRAGLPLVLKGLSMDIHGGERIGIVGRTGAGKSSIMAALFRLTELSGGRIQIDSVDIATVGLYDLRRRLSIIPQDPTLFKGTIRSNLDPFNEHTDLELWSALRKAHLVDQELVGDKSPEEGGTATPALTDASTPVPKRLHLDTLVEEDGLNFSLGQRQLMALARALVRDSRVIVCDEATSSVDFETDQKVQETMAHGFEGKTLLCIAHRLRTILHYDRICVMGQGKIAEMDTPLRLWEAEGVFRDMCDQSGITREDFLGLSG
ncbi:ATP-binding cassette transporter YOR1 [Aspergillus homomorphus CBS 101889]|uniref:Putative ABC multidrug transporter n=1 Tax=Aspergillus homomorphus (strain CBS 101889) TaxID=1450537 RepID=A0A395I783_ASPHC|nr:putative ABC multidrug transporter [Aspergillus homomorphus CBS 101889]RAL16060.1 putative ABC multidrug transporter [Aspergillus homomorphus CBS 101889]